jgi:hypothetical protein
MALKGEWGPAILMAITNWKVMQMKSYGSGTKLVQFILHRSNQRNM